MSNMSNMFKNLKESTIKKEFNFNGQTIIVKNPSKEQQKLIQETIKNYISITNGKINIQIDDLEIMKFLFNELVFERAENNQEISLFGELSEEEIKEVFSHPNELLDDINFEVTEIVRRIGKNSVREYINELELLETRLDEKEIMDKVNSVSKKGNLNMDLSEINWNPEKEKTEEKIMINKPKPNPKRKPSKKKEAEEVANI